MKFLSLIAVMFFTGTVLAHSNASRKIFFVEPKDGAMVTSPLKVKFGLKGMKLCQANIAPKNKKCGHHHLLIDKAPIASGQPVPQDENHIHYGKMQQEAEITLTPGKHTLTLQFADYAHLSYGEKLSETITVEVKAADATSPAVPSLPPTLAPEPKK